ncbi:MAG: YfiR family protein [Alteromonas sp.]
MSLRILLYLTTLLMLSASNARADDIDIDPLRGAYIYHFLQYITWAENSSNKNDMVVCALTSDPSVKHALSDVFSSEVDEPAFQIIFPMDDAQNQHKALSSCKLTYVASNETQTYRRFANQFSDSNVVVTEGDETYRGDIHLYVANGKLRFEIDRTSIHQKNTFKISSKLLRLSKRQQQ